MPTPDRTPALSVIIALSRETVIARRPRAKVKSPEQLEPEDDQTKWSASAIYTVPFGDNGWWSTTAAWSLKEKGHHGDQLTALALESAMKPNAAWTVLRPIF